jgi:hypothetical protein
MSRPKMELKTLQSLRALQIVFDIAKLTTPVLDQYSSSPRPDFGEVFRLARKLAEERQIQFARLREDERDGLVQEALAYVRKQIEHATPSKQECMAEVFKEFSRKYPVRRKDLESKQRRREFEVVPAAADTSSGSAEATPIGLVTYDDPPTVVLSGSECTHFVTHGEGTLLTDKPFLSEHDQQILDGKLRAGALRLPGSIFIIAEDDKPAKLEFCEFVNTVRIALDRIADKPMARAWIFDSPFHVEVIRRHPDRNAITAGDSGPWKCFLGLLENVGDLTRIRRCRICQDVFPMLRKNQLTCSPSCANVERVRKSRGYYKRDRERSLRTGLKRVRGATRRRLIELSQALRSTEEDELR